MNDEHWRVTAHAYPQFFRVDFKESPPISRLTSQPSLEALTVAWFSKSTLSRIDLPSATVG